MFDAVTDAKEEIAKKDVDEESEGDLAEKVFAHVAEEEKDDKSEEDEEAGYENGGRVEYVFELLSRSVLKTFANIELGMEHCHRFLSVQKLVVIFLRKLVVVRSPIFVVILILKVSAPECFAEIGLRVFLHLRLAGFEVLIVDLRHVFLENFLENSGPRN